MEESNGKKIFLCACGTEGLVVYSSQWKDAPLEIEIGFWKYGHDVPYTLKEKWHSFKGILKKGHPYADMVIMDVDTAKDFANAILKACEKPEIEK